MSNQKTRIILAVVLAIVLVSLIATASYYFFPAREPPSDAIYHKPPLVDIRLSQYPGSTETFRLNLTQGETIKINVTLSSVSNDTEFAIPLYFSVGAFENQPLSHSKIIASPPPPYPALPWPSHGDSPTAPKPFEASFDPPVLVLAPNESKSAILTITALEDVATGTYTTFVETGNGEQTGLGGATLWLTIMPK